jgi:hypothetical protein
VATIPRNAALTLKQVFNIPGPRAQALWDDFFVMEPDAPFNEENKKDFLNYCSLVINKGANTKPVLTPGWRPVTVEVTGIPAEISAEYLKPFGKFWYGREVQTSNFESIWVQFCFQCWSIDARNDKATGATRIIGDWRPSQDTVDAVLAAGVSLSDFEMQLGSFRVYHRDAGTFSKTWDQMLIESFRNFAKGPWTQAIEKLVADACNTAVPVE